MLSPDERSVLREILRPPVGSQLDLAVATTFTLDLTSAVVVPLAFASFEISRGGDPVAVLEAVRSASDRVTIFAQVGHMRVPLASSDLMAFLEPMVQEVQAPAAGYLFHPKVWVLRFRDDDDELSYRLVCGTRNLTADTSWDAVVMLDGVVESRRSNPTNRPLADFVRALPAMSVRTISSARAEQISQLADELMTVTWDLPDGVRGVNFHALGIGVRGAAGRLRSAMAGRRGLVVSPFLDDGSVLRLRDDVGDLVLVSRIDALERLQPSTVDQLSCRVLNPLAGLEGMTDDESGTTESTGPAAQQGMLGGLHAKVYVLENGASATMLIGSSNATTAGLVDHNVEFMVEFEGHRKQFGVDQFLGPDADFASILDRYEPQGGVESDQADEVGKELERLLRRLVTKPFRADVTPEEGAWSERVTTSVPVEVPAETRLTIGLLTVEGNVVEQRSGLIDAQFRLASIADVTPFVCVRVSERVGGVTIERSTVVRADLHGDPPGRLDEVLARQVNTPEKFLHFVMLLLALRDGPPPPTPGDGTGDSDSATWVFGAAGTQGLFEVLVRAIAEQPRAISDLDRLVDRLQRTEQGASILPPGFGKLWASVKQAHLELEAAR